MLGKLKFINTLSYIERAGSEYKYFDIDSWSEVASLVNNSEAEIFKINKQFIDDALSKGNSIYLSHDPFDPLVRTGYYEMELDYIQNVLKGTPKPAGSNLWVVEF